MMRTKSILIITALVLVLIAGCKTGSKEGAELPQFIGGTQGVVVSFERNQPPAETFDGGFSPFDVVVKLENKGEKTVPAGKTTVKITGILEPQFGLKPGELSKVVDEELTAMRQDATGKVLPGNFVFAEFTKLNHISKIAGNALDFPIRAQVCYKYETTASTLLCSREDILDPEPNGICEISGNKPVANSGAPIQIANVVQAPRSKESITISFDITHSGTGKPYMAGSSCATQRQFEDTVEVEVETRLSGLSCSGLEAAGEGKAKGPVKTFGQTRTITCTQRIISPVDAVVPVTIRVGYDYEETAQTTIRIKSSGED